MKKIFQFILLVFICNSVEAQLQYEVSKDPKNPAVKVLRGTLDKYLIIKDSSFDWYSSSQVIYTPEDSVLRVFKKIDPKIQFILFGGTWCDDTQFVLPKFFKLQEWAGIPDSVITFYGVNREKHALGHIAEAFGITNVPTIIVMKDGVELGRVVEYGKTGKWDVELGELVRGKR